MATKAEIEAAAKAETEKVLGELKKELESALHLVITTPTMAQNQGDKMVDQVHQHLRAALDKVETLDGTAAKAEAPPA